MMSECQTGCVKLIFLLTISQLLCCADATTSSPNTLKQGYTMKFHDVIYSASTLYELQFFRSEGESNKYYLGISYSSMRIWVANRDTPILDDSAALTIDNKGALMIKQQAGNPLVLYSDDGASGSNRVATLLDNGNLVFSELHSNGSTKKILWQSFDHPTDTLFPGMLLGAVDDKRAPRLSLTSWVRKFDPSSGAFTLDWDPKEQQMIVRRRGSIVWEVGIDMFKRIWPDITPVLSTDGNSFSYSANSTAYLKLSEEGSLIFQVDNSKADESRVSSLKIMEMCYGYNIDNGCVKWVQPKCRSDMPIFTLQSVVFLKADTNETDFGVSYTNASLLPGDCRTICWEDCDCVAYDETDDDVADIGCLFWKGNSQLTLNPDGKEHKLYVISTTQASSPRSLPPQPSTEGHVERERKKSKPRRRRWIWIAMALLLASSVCFILITVMYWCRWKRRVKGDTIEKNTISVDRDDLENNLKVFNFESLSEATNKFSLENKLGEGGFGPVYKGTLREGNEIAVKRLSRSSSQGLEELKNELKLIAKLQHVNLVHLLGYCIQGEEKMLIYEYMPNKSLDYLLFDPSKRCLLDCTTRLNIIEGIAHGLLYLHEYSRLMIIHRDLKASNILLDASLNPKISDFGMAKIFKRNDVMANTERIVGTYGYMSPEYAMEGIFSVKSDIYSFGIIILEIVSGRRNNSFCDSDRHINLIGYAWELWQKDALIELVDPVLKESCSVTPLHRIIHIGLLCVEDLAENRPTVSEVISMLSNVNLPLPSVKRPAFLIWNSSIKKESHSLNDLSLSSITAR